jgi:predicted GTPase
VRYLTNRMREEFDFFANPIIITLTKSKKVWSLSWA